MMFQIFHENVLQSGGLFQWTGFCQVNQNLMVAFENKDYIRTMPYVSEQRNLASKILAMQWNADSFINKKRAVLSWQSV